MSLYTQTYQQDAVLTLAPEQLLLKLAESSRALGAEVAVVDGQLVVLP